MNENNSRNHDHGNLKDSLGFTNYQLKIIRINLERPISGTLISTAELGLYTQDLLTKPKNNTNIRDLIYIIQTQQTAHDQNFKKRCDFLILIMF